MDGGKRVWVPHDVDGFKMGRIVDIGADGISVEPFDTPGKVSRRHMYMCVYAYM